MKAYFVILLCIFFLSGCVTREQIQSTIWLNNFNEAIKPLCLKYPEIADYGFYRKLNDGNIEFISICSKAAVKMLAIPEDDFNRILDEALPQKKGEQ